MRPFVGVLVLVSSSAFAEGSELDAVRTALAELKGSEPVQATLAVSRWERVVGEKSKEASAGASFFVSASKTGVSLTANDALLGPRPERKKDAPPDVLSNIVGGVDLARASRCLNHARPLLKLLETAEVLEDKEGTLGELPCRVLKLKLKTEQQSEGGAEATVERSLTLWLDAEHVPLAMESVEKGSGGFLVVRFESRQTSERKFARVADRLLLVEETEEGSATTMGKTFQSKQTSKLTVK
jgi:hypothetical protein